jgi:outer membrane protein TolC
MKKLLSMVFLFVSTAGSSQPLLTLDSILSIIATSSSSVKAYDYQVRSLDAAAKGARNWDAPELGTGLWMMPYNPALWKRQPGGASGMGQYMVSVQQMFPNTKKQAAEEKYLQSLSALEKERQQSVMNELYAAAKQRYVQLIIVQKKERVIDQNARLLDFMIKNAELRYQNNVGKLNAYYKVKAAIASNEKWRIMLDNERVQETVSLNTLMQRDPSMPLEVDTSYSPNNWTQRLMDTAGLLDARSDIKAIDQNIQVNVLQREAQRATLKPALGVRYDHMFGFGGFPMQYSLMATVRLPMAQWSSRAVKANIESLAFASQSLAEQKEATLHAAIGMVYGLQRDIVSKQREIKVLQDDVIPALQKNFQTMQLAYAQNTEELFALYDSWQTLNSTQTDYLDQLQQWLLMQVELERVLQENN